MGRCISLGCARSSVDDFIFARVVGGIETEFGKVTVVSNHVGNRIRQLGDDASERRFIEGSCQVLHHGEIDFAFFKKGDRPASFASTRVEIQGHVFVVHGCNLSDRTVACLHETLDFSGTSASGPWLWFVDVERARRNSCCSLGSMR